tara:strand:+ start:561 stop:836 length:276 start_codon:yes stop_codon:yes gene_type:complete
MAIDRENKPVEKKIFKEKTKNGMNVVTNMNGEERANGKLLAKYEPGKVFSMSKYRKYLQALEDDNVLEIFPNEPIQELERMRKIFEAQNKD